MQTVNLLLHQAQKDADLPAPLDAETIGPLTVTTFQRYVQRVDCSRCELLAQSVRVYRLSEDQKDMFRAHMPSVLILSTDGGADHSKSMMRILDLPRHSTRSALKASLLQRTPSSATRPRRWPSRSSSRSSRSSSSGTFSAQPLLTIFLAWLRCSEPNDHWLC